jgi:hypothetical protein
MINFSLKKTEKFIKEIYETFNIYKAIFLVNENHINYIYEYLISNCYSVSIINHNTDTLTELDNFLTHQTRILLINEEIIEFNNDNEFNLLINKYLKSEINEKKLNKFLDYNEIKNLFSDINLIIYIDIPPITNLNYYKKIWYERLE